ncbi:MAG: SIMPL domain-containing protein [Candidatus Margulisbacteria bacterium]|nr:SIMPL domain-containing protein [Candidatus Margulisiibacteriota bacterium]
MLKKYFLLSLFVLCMAFNLQAEEKKLCEKKNLIIVQGTDYVESLPDVAYININISIEKNTPEEAAEVGEKIRNNILKVYENNGILQQDILLDSSKIYEYSSRDDNNKHIYQYDGKVKIKDFKKIAILRRILLAADTFEPVKEQWFSKRGLSVEVNVFYALVDKLAELENEALKKAYVKAVEKIKLIAGVSNLKFKIHKVEEGGLEVRDLSMLSNYAKSNVQYEMKLTTDKESTVNTVPTLQRITASVKVTAEIL